MKKWLKYVKKNIRRPLREMSLYIKLLPKITLNAENKRKKIVVMFDGNTFHGGLVDRLKGIISFLHIAEELNIDFKIFFNHPFSLADYLEPNQIQWIAKDDDIRWNPLNSKILYLMEEFHINPLSIIKNSNKRHFLVYCNVDYLPKFLQHNMSSSELWGKLFNRLFKKTSILQDHLNNLCLKNNKIAIHTRFTSILGDFKDVKSELLSADEKNTLLKQLSDKINIIQSNNPEKRIYVFSDSVTFLKHVKTHTGSYILDGTPQHIEIGVNNTKIQNHLKTFIDFFAISECDEIYLISFHKMYNSNFSRYASYISGSTFTHIDNYGK